MEGKYSKKYVLLLDILGFRAIVEQKLKTPDEIYNIVKLCKDSMTKSNAELFYFSDTFVLLIDPPQQSEDTLNTYMIIYYMIIYMLIQNILGALIDNKILVRGALTFGDVYYNENDKILFGPAFIRAYDLEREAMFPRIIIQHIKTIQQT